MQIVEIIKGSDKPLKIQLLEVDENGIERPIDLSAATEIEACFPQDGGGYLTFTLSGGKITREAGAGGIFTVDWEEADTLLLKRGSQQSFQVSWIIATKTDKVIFESALTVKESLC